MWASLIYRPDSADLVRLTGGRSYSEPDPSLIALAPPVCGTPSSINSVAQQYGYIGYGAYQPQNYYGLAAQGGATSAIEQSSEQFGLPFRAYYLTVKIGI